jgi:iron complex outermembrane receptor protein
MKTLVLSSTILASAAFAALPALAQEASETEDLRLESITVVDSGSQVNLTEPYAGGQVARGGRNGLLGNLDFLDSPFSGTAYTEELISNQQADSVGDALQNDPVVRVAKGFGNFQEVYVIRGFPVYSDDITYNGIYGILPRQFVAAELVERVEVFRGANAFLNGAAPGGSGVGGAFNLVPKRAPEDDLNRATVGFENSGQLYGALDIARRSGADDEFGWRFNAVRRNGETSIEGQDRELNVLAFGADYAGDRFRASFDIGYQDNQLDAPRPQVTPTGGVPDAPDASTNYAQPWTYSSEEQLFGVVRGEYDLTDNVTVWAAAGARNGEEANVLANPTATPTGATTAYRFDNTREDDVLSGDVGLRADFATGSIDHRLVVSGSAVSLESRNAYAFSSFFTPFASDLNQPVSVVPPAADFFVGGDLSSPLKTEETQNSSLAIADMMTFLDGQLLVTIGARQQWIETTSFDYNTGAELSSYDDSALTPTFGVVYQPTESISVYGNYSEGLQPGAIAPATSGGVAILNAGEVLDPFRSEQIEIGVKYDSGNFAATFAGFNLSKPNAIVENQIYSASGEQQVNGFEASVFGEPRDGLRLIGGLTWLDAELAETQSGLNEGNTPIGIPEWQANANLEWDVPAVENLSLDGRIVFTGEQYIDEANTAEIDSWTRLDIGARYIMAVQDNDVTLRARIENLTDESYWASTGGFPGANYLVQGGPRTFIVSASVDF